MAKLSVIINSKSTWKSIWLHKAGRFHNYIFVAFVVLDLLIHLLDWTPGDLL